MNFSTPSIIQFRDSFGTTANSQIQPVGSKAMTRDGRIYRWVQAGAANLVAGVLVSAPTSNTSQVALAVNTALMVAGAGSVTVTPGAAITAGQFAGGQLIVSAGAGQGYTYTISGHPAGNSTVNVVFILDRAEGIQVSANSTTVVDLVAPPYAGIVINPTTELSIPVGVTVGAILANNYGFVQTHGQVGCLADATLPGIGTVVAPSLTVAGAVGILDTASVVNGAVALVSSTDIGYALMTGVSAKYKAIFLTIE
jgi:hypothetical protein